MTIRTATLTNKENSNENWPISAQRDINTQRSKRSKNPPSSDTGYSGKVSDVASTTANSSVTFGPELMLLAGVQRFCLPYLHAKSLNYYTCVININMSKL